MLFIAVGPPNALDPPCKPASAIDEAKSSSNSWGDSNPRCKS